jgi:hypothetical protein
MRIERHRHADLEGVVDRLGGPTADGSLAQLVQIVSGGNFATSPNAFFLANPVTIMGDETEGAAGSFYTDAAQTLVLYNVGSLIPTVGALMLAHNVGRWTIDFNG